MNRIMKVFKYQIFDTVKALVVYYVAISVVLALGLLLPMVVPNSDIGSIGLQAATPIFLLIVGLCSFKSGYLFLQGNGFTRRTFYTGGALALAAIAVFMTAVDAVLYALLGLFAQVSQLVPLIYPGNGYTAGLIWILALNLCAAFTGWFTTMLFYRCDNLLKIVLSLLPVVAFIILPILDPATGIWTAFTVAFRGAMGLDGTPNAYTGALSMYIAAAAFLALSWLLVRKAPVKEQDK